MWDLVDYAARGTPKESTTPNSPWRLAIQVFFFVECRRNGGRKGPEFLLRHSIKMDTNGNTYDRANYPYQATMEMCRQHIPKRMMTQDQWSACPEIDKKYTFLKRGRGTLGLRGTSFTHKIEHRSSSPLIGHQSEHLTILFKSGLHDRISLC